MEVKLIYEDLPFSKGYYVLRFDIYNPDKDDLKFIKEIYCEISLNIKEQLSSFGKIW